MSVRQRNNVEVLGDGPVTLVFSHGFGCDQNIWRRITPEFTERYRVVIYDLVGSGLSEPGAYDRVKYSRLNGYANDLLEIVEEFAPGPVIHVSHSVSAMTGLLAEIAAPGRFLAQVMIGPSPCYIDDGEYVGGFSRDAITALLDSLDNNYLGWSNSMAPTVMGAPGQPALAMELANSFCRTDPDIAKHFARVTFLGDYRAMLPCSACPTLILQCSDDLIVPLAIGHYMHSTMPNSTLRIIDNVGHYPHLSSPMPIITALGDFLLEVTSPVRVNA